MSNPAIVTFQIHQDEFFYLGIENVVTEASNFGSFWDNFFKLGGFTKISPYAIGPGPINVWYTNMKGEKIYCQGVMADNVDKVPEGFSLVKFPSCEFLVVTHEWLASNEEIVGEKGNGQCNRYAITVQMPDGYVRYDGLGNPFDLIELERENPNPEGGQRYEVWVPIKKVI